MQLTMFSDYALRVALYLATHGGTVYISGLALGDVAGATQIGLGDVFLATFDAAGENN